MVCEAKVLEDAPYQILLGTDFLKAARGSVDLDENLFRFKVSGKSLATPLLSTGVKRKTGGGAGFSKTGRGVKSGVVFKGKPA